MMRKRITVALLAGAVLGILCIVGASVRADFPLSTGYLFSFWYNRVLMGVVIGLLPAVRVPREIMLRGAILGLLVSFAFFSSTGFQDVMGLAAGIVYGMLIEYAAARFTTIEARSKSRI